VLVHGWLGKPLGDTAGLLKQELGPGWQMFLFDYAAKSTEWAAIPEIAACLADYIADVSAKAGGSKVFLVGHSMGGLAARFAADQKYGGRAISGLIGGVVTLGTPHAGTPWGNTSVAVLAAAFHDRKVPNPFANDGRDASRCLAKHHAGADMQRGCAAPPYLTKTIPLAEIDGSLTVRRTLFGLHMYDITMGGDTIVPIDSAYIGSAAGGRAATLGAKVHVTQVNCTIGLDRILGFAITLGSGALNPKLGLVAARLDNDSAAMDAILKGTTDPALLQFMALANFTGLCAHTKLTTNSQAMTTTADALRTYAVWATPLTAASLASAPVPSLCGHKPGRLVNGKLPGIPANQGIVHLAGGNLIALGDLTGDAIPDAAAVFTCNAGGVGHPDWIVFYGPGPTVLGAFDTGGSSGTPAMARSTSTYPAGDLPSTHWTRASTTPGAALAGRRNTTSAGMGPGSSHRTFSTSSGRLTFASTGSAPSPLAWVLHSSTHLATRDSPATTTDASSTRLQANRP